MITSVTTDSAGNIYAAGMTSSSDLPVTPGVVQPRSAGGLEAFAAKLTPLGRIIWCTYLGGSRDDSAASVAVDRAGNVTVAGLTNSLDFPGSGGTAGNDNRHVFVTKLSGDGSTLQYSTVLINGSDDYGVAMAVDSAGAAFVTATGSVDPDRGNFYGIFVVKLDAAGSLVYRFLHPRGQSAGIAVDAAGSAYVVGTNTANAGDVPTFGVHGYSQALVLKLSPDGSRSIYESTIGGSEQTQGLAIAVDSAGSAYITGITTSVDFPLASPLQTSFGARPLWKSTDGTATWSPVDNLPFANVSEIAVDSGAPDTLFAAAGTPIVDLPVGGIFKTTDAGRTWTRSTTGLTPNNMRSVAVAPRSTPTVYAGGSSGGADSVFRSLDSGATWTAVDSGVGSSVQVIPDPSDARVVYAIVGPRLHKSIDGGSTWSVVAFPGNGFGALAIDARNPSNLYASSTGFLAFPVGGQRPQLFRSSDGGSNWVVTPVNLNLTSTPPLTIDATTNPSTVYAGLTAKSIDNSETWTSLASPFAFPDALGVDPRTGMLIASGRCEGAAVSFDHGQSWHATGSPVPAISPCRNQPRVLSFVPGAVGNTFYAVVENIQTSAFVSKLGPDGATLLYSTFLNGHPSMEGAFYKADEPQILSQQNWGGAIVVDAAGNMVVRGGTYSAGFSAAHPERTSGAGGCDGFVVTLSADGQRIEETAFIAGLHNDGVLALSIDGDGNVVAGGITSSAAFVNGFIARANQRPRPHKRTHQPSARE